MRRAVLGDEEALTVLNEFVQRPHVAARPGYFRTGSADTVAAWFRSHLEKPTTLIRIAEQDGTPVGYVLALLHERAENPFRVARRWCEIDQIAVDEKWRRRGIARALVQSLLAELRERGIRDVELFSWTFNETAHQAFRRLGFAPEVTRFGLMLPE